MSVEHLGKQFAETSTHVLGLSNDVKNQAAEIEAIKAEIDKLCEKHAALVVNGTAPADNKSNSKLMAAYGEFCRNGGDSSFAVFVSSYSPEIKAAMSVGSDPDGGYTVESEKDTTIHSLARDVSPMFRLANVKVTTHGSYKWLVNDSLMSSGWVGENQARPETAAPKLKERTVTVGEIYASPAATQSVLDDSRETIADWLFNEAGTAFAIKQGSAFVSGDGINKPRGFLSYAVDVNDDFTRGYGALQYVAAGSASPTSTQLSDALIAMSMKLRVPYRPNATWIMSRDTARVVRQLKDGMGLQLWAGDGRLVESAPGLLLGFPVALCEDMPSISANALPIALGDWKQGYIILDRVGIRVLRDPYTAKPNVLFYTTKRIGGDVDDFNAIKLLKIAAS